jgi:hypothetical protein
MKLDARLMIILTAIIAVVTAINVVVFWVESEDAAKQTKILAEKAGGIVTSMDTALSDNRIAISRAFDANGDALKASEAQSKAVLDASITAMRLEQRPWITISNLINGPIKRDAKGAHLDVSYEVKNSGRTPALNVGVNARLIMLSMARPIFDPSNPNHLQSVAGTTADENKEIGKFCDAEKTVFTISRLANIEPWGLLVFPQEPPSRGGVGNVTFTAEDEAIIPQISRTTAMYLLVCVTYGSVLDKSIFQVGIVRYGSLDTPNAQFVVGPSSPGIIR